ncbi:MAG: AAA family ATPase [Novosphingobium sp.]
MAMGTYDLLTQHLKAEALHKSSRILIVASPANLATFTGDTGAELMPAFTLAAHQPSEPIADRLFIDVSLAVVEVDLDDRSSMNRIGVIRERHPHVPVVAAISGASLSLVRTLVREGISDVVALPFDVNELLQVSLDVFARREAAQDSGATLAPLVAVARSIGGCGATSVATHLAADFAAHDESGRGTVIVDLDLQFGSVADFLGVRPHGSIADLLGTQGRLDEELLRSVCATTAGGVTVIAAPDSILPLESVDTDDLLRLIQLLRRQFGYVVLDLPANWTNWTLSTVLAANSVVLVVELSIGSLHQAKRRLELFRSVGIDDRNVEIVVNRAEKRLFSTITLPDVSSTLGHSVLGSIALEAPLVSTAQNQGRLVGDVQRKSKFVHDIAEIGSQLRIRWLTKNA